ncbi:hypothetical protein CBM2587_B80078 [Cupriavidus taiwanensis]|uniref:Uncharacterized protein n=1 Tax=Cupriavidus taiwanensis TaxID=164546 RepID=A0A976A7M3_9BURK|nr:hypothetical protein CBM2587_B80078 [Cupriavidus taiwanensis]
MRQRSPIDRPLRLHDAIPAANGHPAQFLGAAPDPVGPVLPVFASGQARSGSVSSCRNAISR